MEVSAGARQTPFVKQLGSSDYATRDKALSSLEKYLTSTRTFTDLELLKLWKGLFFCMWHSDKSVPQQKLALSLAHLLLPLPRSLFIPFLSAFWKTMAREWSSIDVLRMDKFLRLVRCYVNAAFTYLSRLSWEEGLLEEYLRLIGQIPLSTGDAASVKVPDGLRYHVLDVWVDELEKAVGEKFLEDYSVPLEQMLGPLKRVESEGRTKALRQRAKNALADEKLVRQTEANTVDELAKRNGVRGEVEHGKDEEWGGIED